ncbi:MAG: ATP-binding cassette domain-containing protein [Verrucomicrobiales bacterium]|nr:ATP-binding cassette domain-containing protein [Verrucomicrobiales bacterium]
MPAAFQLESVTRRFGDLAAVKRVDASIEQGSQVAFIGPSGSGKTTVIRLLNTMLAADEGTVTVFGQSVSGLGAGELRRLRTRIATIPQHLGLVPNLSVLQNVILGKGGERGTLRSIRDLLIPRKSDVEAIHKILERVGIEEKLFARTSTLSGGQQQRVAIARALFQEPEAILADEPVSAVDPARAKDTVQLLTDLSREHGFTLCVSLHHIELAKEFFPRLIGMRNGEVVLDGAPADLDEADLARLYQLSDEEMMTDA